MEVVADEIGHGAYIEVGEEAMFVMHGDNVGIRSMYKARDWRARVGTRPLLRFRDGLLPFRGAWSDAPARRVSIVAYTRGPGS